MKNVYQILSKLGDTSGRNDKEIILKNNLNNELLKDVLQFIYDPFTVTGLSTKKIKKKISDSIQHKDIGLEFIDVKNYLLKNNTGRDLDIKIIQNFIANQPKELQKFYEDVVTKSLKIGVTAKTLNKCFGKGFIKEFNVMLAQKYWDYADKIKGEFIITEKLDGIRGATVIEDGMVNFFTRQGQAIIGLSELEKEVLQLKDGVYDGELLLRNDNCLNSADLYRETVKVVRKDGEKKNVEFHIFDMLSLNEFYNGKSNTNCKNRKLNLNNLLNNNNFEFIKEVKTLYIGDNKEIIVDLLDKVIFEGKEGLMLNTCDGKYECKRSKEILKIKKFNIADLRVLEIIEGTGKNIGRLGAITVEFIYEGENHTCNCGSGFSDEERVLYWNNPELIINKIVEIGYFEISKNQDGGFGLRFPTWKSRIREDKNEISMY